MTIGVGVHEGLSFEEYVALPYANSSSLKYARKSMKKVKAALDGKIGKETKQTRHGTLVHTLVLEPKEFDARYVMDPGPGPQFLTAKGKPADNHRATKAWTEWVESLGDKTILTKDELANAEASAEAILSNEAAKRFVAGDIRRELTIVWDEDGLLCKCRIDILGDYITDLKTSGDVYEFEKSIANWDYDYQAAFYRRGVRKALGVDMPVALIAAESEYPNEVRASELDPDDIAAADPFVEEDIVNVRRCYLSDTWPGAESPDMWRLPEWKRRQRLGTEAF